MRRVFVALDLDDAAAHRLAAALAARVPRGMPGRPVAPENWHLTLRFLGFVEDSEVDRIVRALDDADLGDRFRIRLGSLGAFPHARRARVLWVGLDLGADEASALALRVEDALEAAGIEAADRPFRPHLTVSRLRPVQDVTPIVEAGDPLGPSMEVDRVTLFESHLRRGGAQYKVVEEFPLG